MHIHWHVYVGENKLRPVKHAGVEYMGVWMLYRCRCGREQWRR